MSTSGNVDEVRKRIIQLAREIEEMSQQRMPSRLFFDAFLKRVVGAVGARAGAVWMRNGSNRLDLLIDHQLAETGFHENPQAPLQNQKLLQEVLSNGQACTHSPEDEGDVELPTRDLIILGALQRDKECVGVVEIFQRSDTPLPARAGFLQFVEQMCGYACRYLDRQTEADEEPIARSEFSEKFENFSLQLHRSLNPTDVAATCANDARLLIGCDRLSVAVQVGPRTDIRAISGQGAVNQRSNLVRTMRKLASRVLATREILSYTGKPDELPPQIEEPLAEYIQEGGSRMVLVVPLIEPEPLVDISDESEETRRIEKPRRIVGGLVIEQVAESQPRPGLHDRIEVVKDHVAGALANALQHERLFGMKLWRFLGQTFSWLEGRNRWKAGIAAVGVVVLGLVLALVPYDYRVEATGRLMPTRQQDIFAPGNGKVFDVPVEGGQEVKEGDVLVRIRDLELDNRLETLQGEQQNNLELLAGLRAQHDRAIESGVEEDVIQLSGRMREAQIKLKSLARSQQILLKEQDELTIKATRSGVVATFQIRQKLLNRPVNRGEKLLEIMDTSDRWRLELEVEEHRMGHVLRHQQERKEHGLEDPEGLPIEFVLATETEKTFDGRLSRIATRADAAEAAEAGGSVVEVYALPDKDGATLPRHQIGAEVSAKIHCGQRSLFYVLFGDVIEFVRKQFWL